MCGIVLVGSRNMTQRDLKFFEQMLFADTFRGPHSTGVFTSKRVWKGGKYIKVNPLQKLAVEGPEFLQSGEWEYVKRGFDTTKNAHTGKTTPINRYGSFYVGHNRYATVGAINAVNAHPFRHGQITMVHNGTLVNQNLLPESKDFEVDSDNVCYSLNKWGVDKTIQNLDGAFTLVWHNNETDTLHVIRNDERPFHFAETQAGDWFGASEEEMLMWILMRGKVKPNIKRHFEAEVGVEYIFDVSAGSFKFKEERKHELPDFTPKHYSGWGGGWGYGNGPYASQGRGNSYSAGRGSGGYTEGYGNSYGHNNPTGKPAGLPKPVEPRKKSITALLKEHSLPYVEGGEVTFAAMECNKYSGSETLGRLVGYLDDVKEYVEVINHGFTVADFTEDDYYTGKIVNAYIEQGVLTIVASQSKLKDEDELFECSGCHQQMIKFHESESVKGVCKGCYQTFFADGMSYDTPEIDFDEDVDLGLVDDEDQVKLKTLTTGAVVKEEDWDAISQCSCGTVVEWGDAEKADFHDGFLVCGDCAQLLALVY